MYATQTHTAASRRARCEMVIYGTGQMTPAALRKVSAIGFAAIAAAQANGQG